MQHSSSSQLFISGHAPRNWDGAWGLCFAAGWRKARHTLENRREGSFLQSTNHCDVAITCSLHFGVLKLQAQAIQAPANPSLALYPSEIPAALLPRTLISEPGRPVPVPDPTNLLFQSQNIHGCEVELIIGVITLSELCGDQVMLEGEEVLG